MHEHIIMEILARAEETPGDLAALGALGAVVWVMSKLTPNGPYNCKAKRQLERGESPVCSCKFCR